MARASTSGEPKKTPSKAAGFNPVETESSACRLKALIWVADFLTAYCVTYIVCCNLCSLSLTANTVINMQPIVLGALPDELLAWRGTASALADQCNALLPNVGLAHDAGCANERLVRHYVQVGVLTPPQKEGREALFDHTHVGQFLAARYLLNDGWSLAKISELFRAAGPEHMTKLVPAERQPTPAEQALARMKRSSASPASSTPPVRAMRAARPDAYASPAAFTPPPVSDPLIAYSMPAPEAASESLTEPLRQAAEISMRRMSLQSTLTDLGNPSGQPTRREKVCIELAPWCQVYLDMDALRQLPAEAIDRLGSALSQTLHEERISRGEKS